MTDSKKSTKGNNLWVLIPFFFFTGMILGLMVFISIYTYLGNVKVYCAHSTRLEISVMDGLKDLKGNISNSVNQEKPLKEISKDLIDKVEKIEKRIEEGACSNDYYGLPSIPYSVVIIFLALLISAIITQKKDPEATEATETTETTETTKSSENTETTKTLDTTKTTKAPENTKVIKTTKTTKTTVPPPQQ